MKKTSTRENEAGEISASAFKLTLLSFVILVAYAVFMFVLGYILSTILYLAVMFYVLGERRPLAVGAYSVSIVLIVYVVFKSILDVPIPGLWG
ncbi:MAG: tripartite tricarboxylate transporter TctB family protein, partial [Candidatus Hinthialibacter sp.]